MPGSLTFVAGVEQRGGVVAEHAVVLDAELERGGVGNRDEQPDPRDHGGCEGGTFDEHGRLRLLCRAPGGCNRAGATMAS
jgi:hypothetical protein